MTSSASPARRLELIYFPSRCRGDLARQLLFEAGLEFVETRILRDVNWPGRKSEFAFGQLPVLLVEESGRRTEIAQSHAIARYLVKLTDPSLLGDNADEAANVDMYYYQTDDAFMAVILPFYEDPKSVTRLFEDNWCNWMAPFEKALTGSDYLANGKLSLADYHLFDVAEVMAHFRPQLLEQTPRVKAHRERMAARPGIAKFMEYVKALPFTNSGHF